MIALARTLRLSRKPDHLPLQSKRDSLLTSIREHAAFIVAERASHGVVCDDSLSSFVMDHESQLLSTGYINSVATSAVPLIADKVSLPSAAGEV